MTSPSQEHLLGFLLGALEPAEHERLEREIAENPALTRQLEALSEQLSPLEAARQTHVPPVGLATRVCSFVFENCSSLAPSAESEGQLVSPARHGLAAAMSSEAEFADNRAGWSLADLVVAAGIFIAAAMLFFPAIANSRYHAQLAQCQHNLRDLGYAFTQFANQNPGGELPLPAMSGNRAAAGIQAVTLREQGFLDRDNVVYCPAAPLSRELAALPRPSFAEIDAAIGAQWAELVRRAGGTFAHSLGYRSGGRYGCRQGECNSNYVLAADAPVGVVPNLVSNHHDGRGQNVVYIDCRVAYVLGCGTLDCGDSIFWNSDRQIAAGDGPRDSVVATSGTRPFPEGEER
jgi:hypothetical protein